MAAFYRADGVIFLILMMAQFLGAMSYVPLYRQPNASVNDRVLDLVGRMTLDEKIAQLILPFGAHYPADYIEFNQTGLGAT